MTTRWFEEWLEQNADHGRGGNWMTTEPVGQAGESAEAFTGRLTVTKAVAYMPISKALLDEIDAVNIGMEPMPRPPWSKRVKARIRELRQAAGRQLYAMVSGEEFPDPGAYDRDDW